ncbi:MAG: hypothetical protein ABSF62_19475 [Bryobacteraceae bacterium]
MERLGQGRNFDGNADANIAYGISILKTNYATQGNNTAGLYVGNLQPIKLKNGTVIPPNPLAVLREATWNNWATPLTTLFSITDCFPHQ